jgi:thiol-disulfide isomerase/thioredoxin
MGKAERIRRMNARERIAAQQAAAARAESRKRLLLASGSVLAVLAIVAVIIIVKNLSSPAPAGASATGSQQASVTSQITTVPASTLNSVGAGTASKLTATKGQPALTSGGKPELLYMGAEYCPYCAAERWALVVALSRFGSFSNLSYIHSSSTDVYPNTPTLSFYKSSYVSSYLNFTPVEMNSQRKLSSGGYATLQKPTTAEAALIAKYDAPPYVTSSNAGAVPFVNIGNQYLVSGSQYLPSDLAGLTWAQVAADIRNPSSTVGKDVGGTANAITAAICKITHNAPAAVCNSAGVKAAAGSL